MSRAFGYFRLQFKRFFRLTPVVLILSALLLGAVGLAFFGLFSDAESDEQNSLVNIGLVGDMDDNYMGLAVSALQNLDSSRFSLAVKTVEDEEEAAAMLRRGELVAYLVLPDNFIEEAISGNVQKIACVTSSGAADFGTKVSTELMMTVTQMVANSQKAVFGFQKAARARGVSYDRASGMGDDVAIDVIKAIIDRESAYEVEEIGTSGMNDVKDPLLCGMLVLLLMLWGITCCTIFSSRNRTLFRVLSSKGTGCIAQVLGEYASYLIFMAATLGVLTAVIFALSPLMPSMTLLDGLDFSRLVPGIIVPVFTISAMHFFLYEVAGGVVSSALLQFFCAMGTGYVCGCIYPAYFFPRGVQSAASILPAWSCRLWLDELLAGKLSFGTFAILAAYFAVFLILSVVVRRARILREGGGA